MKINDEQKDIFIKMLEKTGYEIVDIDDSKITIERDNDIQFIYFNKYTTFDFDSNCYNIKFEFLKDEKVNISLRSLLYVSNDKANLELDYIIDYFDDGEKYFRIEFDNKEDKYIIFIKEERITIRKISSIEMNIVDLHYYNKKHLLISEGRNGKYVSVEMNNHNLSFDNNKTFENYEIDLEKSSKIVEYLLKYKIKDITLSIEKIEKLNSLSNFLKEQYGLLNELKNFVLKCNEEINDMDLISSVKKKILK